MQSKARISQLTEMLSRIIHILTSEETRSCLASIVVVAVVVEEIYISGSAGWRSKWWERGADRQLPTPLKMSSRLTLMPWQ